MNPPIETIPADCLICGGAGDLTDPKAPSILLLTGFVLAEWAERERLTPRLCPAHLAQHADLRAVIDA